MNGSGPTVIFPTYAVRTVSPIGALSGMRTVIAASVQSMTATFSALSVGPR